MTEFRYDHVHLRSPDPEATAAWYKKMFGAEVIRAVMSNGLERTDIKLGGVNHFIAKVPDDAPLSDKADG
ncbi:MAG TPA: VOC family protein, partial [Stellaceae bacterium]